MQLSKYEQESIITYNEAEQTANIYTHNKPLRRKLDKLVEERPQECQMTKESRGGQAGDYTIPKSWIHVYPPRKSAPMSEERRAELRERLEAVRKAKKTGVQT